MAKENPVDVIVAKIIAKIEEGAGEFRMPWHRPAGSNITVPRNVLTGKPYNGINVFSLWLACDDCGYQSGLWGTYKQWQEKGATVRKGEKGTGIIFWKPTTYAKLNEATGETETKASFLVKASWVFNAAQVQMILRHIERGCGQIHSHMRYEGSRAIWWFDSSSFYASPYRPKGS